MRVFPLGKRSLQDFTGTGNRPFEEDFANATEAEMNEGAEDDAKVDVDNVTVTDTNVTTSRRRTLLGWTSGIKVGRLRHVPTTTTKYI